MKNILSLISSAKGSLSSKRAQSIYFSLLWLVIIIAQWNGATISDSVVYSTSGLIAALQGLTLFKNGLQTTDNQTDKSI